ncbi:hypothetical protein [Halobacillus litoralis]|uniref:hypothetical protein n=1 Tax=Halobacillus litoralis TaxID=45668 RepID=UPI001CD7B155|nr:hypothetical protein [Halobacillus litoralis]MCA1021537.1 hypothetical protein [Halobacillus litoralis]
MREPGRIDRILNKIKILWERSPDLRFNQLIDNLSWEYSNNNNGSFKDYGYSKFENDKGDIVFHRDVVSISLFHLEDDKFEKFLDQKIAVK